jgi:uncharacterized protein YegP (UPF0339 family)
MPKFTVFKGEDKQWRFNMKADNGEIILQSESYKRRKDALDTVEVIRTTAAASPVEVKQSLLDRLKP